ncbi:MAG TPA: thioesterase family protein [Salinisphaeraceae bacterium]|nr:thioesterase family protein [Salinisphaeraceae bacterium]
MRQPMRSEFAFFVPIKVKWGEMDVLGHVNNTVFFRYSEDGRMEYIEAITRDGMVEGNHGPILADLRCTFLQQLRFPATVEIGTRTRRIGRSSLALAQGLFHAESDQLIAAYESTVVWFDYGAQTSMRIPEPIRESIRVLELVAPEE